MTNATGRYPGVQFVNRDILTLMPNYRGSVGRGQAFQELNVDNLGVGDLWDIESAIDHLDAEGMIDPNNVVCMGWSQGGYISAMATTHSDRFKAISVGAGISDWYTYHISTDIPHFTTNYLSASPFRDRSTYVKTSPMTKIQEAKTPTIIQHGGKAFRLPSEVGDTLELELLWETKPKDDRYYASSVYHEGLIYGIVRRGHDFSVIDAETGEVVYEERFKLGKGETYPSLMFAGDHLFVSNDNGTTVVMKPGREPEEVLRNSLGEIFRSSPVFVGSRMYVRGMENLYCIGKT